MLRFIYVIKLLAVIGIGIPVLFGCSEKQESLKELPAPYILANLESYPCNAADFLKESYPELKLNALDSVVLVRPAAFQSQMGETAETYLKYLFVGKAKRTYKTNNGKLFAEILQFADETHAYGFYALTRSPGQMVKRIGGESYQSGNSRYMTKSDCVVILSAENEGNENILENLAITISEDIAGQKSIPATFLLFPYKNKIVPSQQYFPYAYLDIPGMRDVYTSSYIIEKDTVTLFFTMDSTGEKFAYLKQYAETTGKVTQPVKKFPYDGEKSLAFNHPGKGVIIGGLKLNKFVGIVGYAPESSDKLLFDWLRGIRQ
ncbi:MAG: hypothetical protein DWP97_11380 [Calditrichaeota bacterium]|nr:MAG: hypothetical protein DWP97_11380 [Calditrichota bacterium]